MKSVLIHIRDSVGPERLIEAVRVAAGLSQQPGLQVSLRLPPLPQVPAEPRLREYFILFAEKGVHVYAEPRWLPSLPPLLRRLQPASGSSDSADARFELFIPF